MAWPAWLQRDSPPFLALLLLAALGAAMKPVRESARWIWRLVVAANVIIYRALRDRASRREMEMVGRIPVIEAQIAQLLALEHRVEAIEREAGRMRAEILSLPSHFDRLEEAAERTERTVATLAETIREEVGTLTRLVGDELRRRRPDSERP